MKVLIIGGTKFLGYHLTEALLEQGAEITLYSRGAISENFQNAVNHIKGDRSDYKRFYDAFYRQKFDAVFDLIGYEPEDVEISEKIFRNSVGQYFFISTGQVYLITENKHLPAREEDYFQPLIPCPQGEEQGYEYGLKKRRIEDFLYKTFQTRRFPTVRFRCPIINGPRDYSLRLYSYILRIADGGPVIIPEGGDSLIRHVYVRDVVTAMLSVLGIQSASGKVFNLAQDETLLLSGLIKRLAEIMKREPDILEIPGKELDENGISRGISPFSSRWVSYLDPSFAEEEIGFHSTPLEKWLSQTIDYFVNEYAGPAPDNYENRSGELEMAGEWKSYH